MKEIYKKCFGCQLIFIVNRLTIHCKCDRWYCLNCWEYADEDNFPVEKKENVHNDGWFNRYYCERDRSGAFNPPECNNCAYSEYNECCFFDVIRYGSLLHHYYYLNAKNFYPFRSTFNDKELQQMYDQACLKSQVNFRIELRNKSGLKL